MLPASRHRHALVVVTRGALNSDHRARGERRSDPPPPRTCTRWRTPATIMSSRSSTPGRNGSRYIRAEEMPSSNSSLRARSYTESGRRTQPHRTRPRPSRSSPCTAAHRDRGRCRQATRRSRRTRTRSSPTTRRPPAPARRRADAARRRRPRRTCPARAAASAHSSTAENWRPTPVIIRVVHIAPAPRRP